MLGRERFCAGSMSEARDLGDYRKDMVSTSIRSCCCLTVGLKGTRVKTICMCVFDINSI